jgi:hypothetical protein
MLPLDARVMNIGHGNPALPQAPHEVIRSAGESTQSRRMAILMVHKIQTATSPPSARVERVMAWQHTFGDTLLAVRLHCNVSIEMVQSTVRLLAAIPSALVHALDLLVSSTRPLVLLGARNGHKAVHLDYNC